MSLDLFAIWDEDGILQDVNERWEAATGWRTDELQGSSLWDLVHPEDVEDVQHACGVMVRQRLEADCEMRFRDRQGDYRWLTWSARFDTESGLFYGVARDRTESRDLEILSRAIVEEVEDYAIFMLDTSGKIRTWNRGAERLKGYAPDEIIGQHVSVFYPPETKERPLRLLGEARQAGRTEDEGWRVRKDGSRFWANVVITAVHDSKGNVIGFTKLTRDLTQRRRNEEAQRKAFQQAVEIENLERLSLMRANLLNLVAHELRTPLTPLRMQVQMLRSPRLGPLNDGQERAASILERNIVRLSRLIDDILQVSRLEADRLQMDVRPVAVDELLEDVEAAFEPAADDKGVALTTEWAPGVRVECDPDRMLQVLYNLMDNAIKFTPSGGSVTMRATEGDGVLLQVEDTGRGLSEEECQRVFEPFVQIHGTEKHGSGLGLYISRAIVERHGGSITCRSKGPEAGTIFDVRLPSRH